MASKLSFWCVLVAATFGQFSNAADCSRYSINKFQLETKCQGNAESVMSVSPNFMMELAPNCDVIANGCIEVRQAFNQALASFRVVHGIMVIQDQNQDACERARSLSGEGRNILQNLGLGQGCPVQAGRQCYDRKVISNMQRYSDMLGMAAGNTIIDMTLQHENGAQSCLRGIINVSRNW